MRARFFKKKPQASEPQEPPPSLADTTAAMDTKLETLNRQIKSLSDEIAALMKSGGTSAAKKSTALQLLRRKKMLEQRRDQLMGTQMQLEELQGTTESIQATYTAVQALTHGSTAMKAELAKVDMSKLEDLHEDLEETKLLTDEIQSVFANPVDDGDLEDMYNELLQQSLPESAQAAGSGLPAMPASVAAMPSYFPELPAIPRHRIGDPIAPNHAIKRN